ncbi:MAG: M55 family metallopeptidase [Syntrophothermus sp.]
MKVFISVDLEGIGGVVNRRHQAEEGREYEYARRLMIEEANAAVQGALEGGATEVVVNDSHGDMANLLPEMLHREAMLISGSPKPLSMVEGVQTGCQAAIFIGYHAGSGTAEAVLDHTYVGRVVHQIRINGRTAGEPAINAGVCGAFGVPVVMVAGDKAVTEEARALIPGVVTVAVKEGLGRLAAISMHPEKARAAIRKGAAEAVRNLNRVTPFKFSSPVELEVDLLYTTMADVAELVPGVRRTGPRTVAFSHEEYITVFKAMRAILTLAGTVA